MIDMLIIALIVLSIFLSSLLSLAVILFLLFLFLLVRPAKKREVNEKLLCEYAHRGLHGDGVPENSLEAFELACKSGYGIELDVQLSRDGEVMVFHDYTLIRMTGCDKKLCELDAEELKKLTLGESDQTIPTFKEVLALVDGRVPLLVELKGESTDVSLCAPVAEILKGYSGEYCIESFNPMLVREMKKQLPGVFAGQLYTNVVRDKKKASALNILLTCMALNCLARPDFVAYNQLDRNSLPVKLTTKFFKAEKFIWTAKGEDDRAKAKDFGEYAIFEMK